MIKLVLVDDHHIIRTSLQVLLDRFDVVKVVADVANGEELLSLLENGLDVDIILSDVLMPNMDGIEITSVLTEKYPNIHIVLLSMLEDIKYATIAISAGVSAYLLKNVEVDELIFCLQHVMKGNKYLSSQLCISILDKYNRQLVNLNLDETHKIIFSDREKSVLELIAEGKTNQEIADELFLSRRTVESQREGLINKAGVKNTAALIRYAVLNGYVN